MGASGNFGILDQVVALTWIKDIISDFGGGRCERAKTINLWGFQPRGRVRCRIRHASLKSGC